LSLFVPLRGIWSVRSDATSLFGVQRSMPGVHQNSTFELEAPK
jgi:hypothetical protein